mmetsp:Transcript_26356/g.44481  ORF Transcript_26356/g.44481 Transcript_26356/m.44481 type:complete len:101 (+) Transcript_26356:127-429(+)
MEKAYDESHRAVVDKHLARFASETWDTQEEGDNHGSLEATLETNGYLERLRQKKQSVKELNVLKHTASPPGLLNSAKAIQQSGNHSPAPDMFLNAVTRVL